VRLDRVAEDIFIFVSGMYAQVTATVLITKQGAIVVDTMPFPTETRQILAFVENKLGPNSVRYVILTHHHSDHVYGAYLFEGAEIIAHDKCREALERSGQATLERARRENAALTEVELSLPSVTFRREMHIHLGHRHLRLLHTPGHTPDGVSVFVMDEKVLIAGDCVMPVPHFVGGSYEQLSASLEIAKGLKPSFIVQGHGDVLLRGEVDDELDSSMHYIRAIVKRVEQIVQNGDPPQKLREVDIEACGKSRIPLDGLVSRLHLDNLVWLYRNLSKGSNGDA
jgi:cyclase